MCPNNQENSRVAECWDEIQRHICLFLLTHFYCGLLSLGRHLPPDFSSLHTYLQKCSVILGGRDLGSISESLLLPGVVQSCQEEESWDPSPCTCGSVTTLLWSVPSRDWQWLWPGGLFSFQITKQETLTASSTLMLCTISRKGFSWSCLEWLENTRKKKKDFLKPGSQNSVK